VELHYSKDEILRYYLNRVYLGRGAYGVQAAALRHFNKTVDELSLSESAQLGGLPRSPGRYPVNDPQS